jgi:glycosyltransferase involved in cell wall biosynthesis
MKIKVCYLIGSLATGGAEGQVLELIRKLNPQKFVPSLVLETTIGFEQTNGWGKNVRTLGVVPTGGRRMVPRGYHAARALRKLCAHLDEMRPDILHAFLPACVIYAGAARLLKRFPQVIASRRSLVDCYRPNGRVAAFADTVATRASDFVLGNSRAIAEEIVRLDGVPEARTQVIYNGVDAERFSPAKRPGIRGESGWSEEQIVFGMVANFIPYKRHLDFVRSAALIHAAVPRSRFLLVGEDRGEMPAVRKAIAEAGLEPYTRIVPGTGTPELAFAAMDVYICTSETEGFSNVLLEAMATGLPVVATNVGGNPEAVSEGLNGTLVPARSPELIVRAAVELAANRERLQQWAENSRRRAEELFSLKKMVQAHEELYTRLASQTRTSAWKRLAGRA